MDCIKKHCLKEGNKIILTSPVQKTLKDDTNDTEYNYSPQKT